MQLLQPGLLSPQTVNIICLLLSEIINLPQIENVFNLSGFSIYCIIYNRLYLCYILIQHQGKCGVLVLKHLHFIANNETDFVIHPSTETRSYVSGANPHVKPPQAVRLFEFTLHSFPLAWLVSMLGISCQGIHTESSLKLTV